MAEPAGAGADYAPADLHDGLVTWVTVDAPWLSLVDERRLFRALEVVPDLEPDVILSSHLPPALGITDSLLDFLGDVVKAPIFVDPDQAKPERMMTDSPGN